MILNSDHQFQRRRFFKVFAIAMSNDYWRSCVLTDQIFFSYFAEDYFHEVLVSEKIFKATYIHVVTKGKLETPPGGHVFRQINFLFRYVLGKLYRVT